MIYSEKQLESFSTPPFKYETKQIIRTKDAIQEVLTEHIPTAQIKESFNLSDFKYDIYLQGSYKNSTNISKSSDVDIIIELSSVYIPNTQLLTEDHKRIYNSSRNPSKYRFAEFKSNVHSALVAGFGNSVINPLDKCITLIEHDNFCNADIVPCFTHKKFTMFESYSKSSYYEGIEFITDSGHVIINFPHQHYTELINKNNQTSGRFKETVRMFKTLKEELIDNCKIGEGVAKSYYIENLLFNVPDELFAGTYQNRFSLILDRLINDFNSNSMLQYSCANGFQKLISNDTWSIESARQFLLGLIHIRDNNEF
jgi:hypothetical protein